MSKMVGEFWKLKLDCICIYEKFEFESFVQ